jgi:small GTP-binding protein
MVGQQMATIEDRIREIEEEIKKTQYNKATERHIGLLKAKISKLQIEADSHKGHGGTGFSIPKSGDATVALVGFPNVGKSSILNRLTDSESEVGSFAFTTLKVIPGILEINGAKIQILDLPGIIENAASGSGRGREILSTVRSADLILLVADVQTLGLEKIKNELYRAGIVIDRKKKNVSLKRTSSGGLKVYRPRGTSLDEASIRDILKEFKITNAELYIREKITADDLIDFLKGNVVYIPSIVAVNKIDIPHDEARIEALRSNWKTVVEISASKGIGTEKLKDTIFESLQFVRVYLKDKAGRIDFERPLVLTKGSKVRDVCRRISREMMSSFRYAIMTGPNRKMGEIRAGLDYDLRDQDIVTVVSRN